MTLLAFFIGLAVLITAAAAGRHVFYLFWWGLPPREMDSDLDDVAIGWFVGTLVASLMFCVAVIALLVGTLILGATCDPPVTETPRTTTTEDGS